MSNAYLPFSEFEDQQGYAGFCPSRWYITNIYMDYMQHICPVLDQCMAALTGYVIKWDHSFKLPKYPSGKLLLVLSFPRANSHFPGTVSSPRVSGGALGQPGS
jgi:hypothetical protein